MYSKNLRLLVVMTWHTTPYFSRNGTSWWRLICSEPSAWNSTPQISEMISYVGIRIDVDFIGFFVRCSLSQFFPSIQTGRPFPTKQMYTIALAKHELCRNSCPVCSLN